MEKKIIISINSYRLGFLNHIIKSCLRHIDGKFLIILNNSVKLQEDIKKSNWLKDKPFVKINPNPMDKRRFHGSLVKGIVSNMELAIKEIDDWENFIILSNRSEFSKKISNDTLEEYKKQWDGINKDVCISNIHGVRHSHPYVIKNGQRISVALNARKNWHYLRLPKSFKEYFAKKPSWGGYHEGFSMDKTAVQFILDFFRENKNIAEEVYNNSVGAIEEVVFHTLSLNSQGKFAAGMTEIGDSIIEGYDFSQRKYIPKITNEVNKISFVKKFG